MMSNQATRGEEDTGNQPPEGPAAAEAISEDDPHKVEKLTKIGHEADPDEGSE